MQFKHSRVGLFSVVTPVISEEEILKAEVLKSELVSLVETGRTHVAADLSDLGYISSEIIGALVSLHKILLRLPGEFVVVVSNENLIEILQRTGVTEVLHLVHSTKELQAKSAALEAKQKGPASVIRSEFDLLKEELKQTAKEEPESKPLEVSLDFEPVTEAPVAAAGEIFAPKEEPSEDSNFSDALEEGLLSFGPEEPEQPAPPPPAVELEIEMEAPVAAPPPVESRPPVETPAQVEAPPPVEKQPDLAEILAAESKEPPSSQPAAAPAEPEKPAAPKISLEIRSEKPTPPPSRPGLQLGGLSGTAPMGSASRQTRTNAQIVLQAPVYRSTRKMDRPPVSQKKHEKEEEKSGAKPALIAVGSVLAVLVLAFGIYKLLAHFNGIKSGIGDVVTTVQSQAPALAQVEKIEKAPEQTPDARQNVEEITKPPKVEDPFAEGKQDKAEKKTKAPAKKPKADAKEEKRREAKSAAAPAPAPSAAAEPKTGEVKETASAATGSIFFASNPAVADIFLNGQKIGSTNVSTLDLPVGDVTLVFKKGGVSLTKQFTIKPGKNESQFFYLNEAATPTSSPSSAAEAPVQPKQEPQAPAPEKKAAEPAQAAAPPPPPAPPAVKPAPVAPRPVAKPTGMGKVFIVSMPQLADIYIDGKKIGKANESNLTFPVGKVTLTLKKGKLSKTQTLTIKEGENDPVLIQME